MNQSRNLISLFSLCIILLAAAAACKSSKKAVTPVESYSPGAQTEITQPQPKGAPSLDDDYRAMTAAYTTWNDVSVPVKVQIRKPKNLSVSGTLSMAYGKALSLSLKMLFIEVATIYADHDSVLVVSKAAGAYYSESMERLTEMTGLTLADIQSLMLGQAFVPGQGTATPAQLKQFRLADDPETGGNGFRAWSLAPKKMPKGVDWHFTGIASDDAASGVTPQIFALDIVAGKNTLRCTFAQSELTAAGIIASSVQLEGTVKKHAVDVIVSGMASRASWNTGRTPSKPSVPRNARRLTTAQVFKLLDKF